MVTIEDEFGKITLTPDNGFKANAIIGVKGDTNLDGTCAADDAANVLIYAAAVGAGKSANICDSDAAVAALGADVAENFVYFLSDVNGESENGGASVAGGTDASPLNAEDAAFQLIYAAKNGAQGHADWVADVLGEDVAPKYSLEIYNWTQANK
ncbi:MAG: hypothetical protein II916_09240 [Oscillospiraceae bacterium]|nr:hypothetical protein [Oscillospiraceae bacterium]